MRHVLILNVAAHHEYYNAVLQADLYLRPQLCYSPTKERLSVSVLAHLL